MAKKDKKTTTAAKEVVEEIVEEPKEEEIKAVKLDRSEEVKVKQKVPVKEEKEDKLIQRL
jgi:hypothetical protein